MTGFSSITVPNFAQINFKALKEKAKSTLDDKGKNSTTSPTITDGKSLRIKGDIICTATSNSNLYLFEKTQTPSNNGFRTVYGIEAIDSNGVLIWTSRFYQTDTLGGVRRFIVSNNGDFIFLSVGKEMDPSVVIF